MKNYNQFINENINNELLQIHRRLKELDKNSLDIYHEIYDLEREELAPILSKIIDTNNKELINRVINYKPIELYLSPYAFLHQKIYTLNQKPVSPSEITNYDVPYDKLNKVFEKIKKQYDLSDEIDKEAKILINKIIETNDLSIMRYFIDVVQNLNNSRFFKKFNELRNKNSNSNDDED